MDQLPIDEVLPKLRDTLTHSPCVVLSAETGAGKTTRVPVSLLQEKWLADKKIIMLEPRRIAAQRAAMYMSRQLGEQVGGIIGYRMRGENKTGESTRVEVVTEGILTRMLQKDQAVTEVGLIIFDEFHERSIHADLGLALALDVQKHLRNDLRILVMSATLDHISVAKLLGDAPVVVSKGRSFPVVTNYLTHELIGVLEPHVTSSVLRSLRQETGDILVFLPGLREIRRVEIMLAESELPEGVTIHVLHSAISQEKQQAALGPSSSRKIILSTSIAETSITIEGIRVVIDAGLARSQRFDPRRGMSGLVTVPVSVAAADQRKGRAGRQEAGVCYRLWTESQHTRLPEFAEPEIKVADLAPLALELACWGDPEGTNLRFLNPPPSANLSQARELLENLGAVDSSGNLLPHGREMERVAVHPRLAHMLLRGKELGLGPLACDVAALLEEQDLFLKEGHTDFDLNTRWYVLKHGGVRDKFALDRVRQQARRLCNLINVKHANTSGEGIGVLLALAYPERVAKQREPGGGRYQLASGTGAILPKGSLLSRHAYLAIGDVDGVGDNVRIQLAAPLSAEDIIKTFDEQLKVTDDVRWDDDSGRVVARRLTKFGDLEIRSSSLRASPETIRVCVLDGIRKMGLQALPWTKEAISIRARSEWLRSTTIVDEDWPNLSDENLVKSLEQWLGPFLDGVSKKSDLQNLNMSSVIGSLFTHHQQTEIARLAPTHHSVPTGSRIPLDYGSGSFPILAVRLQEMFGETATPTVGGGRIKVLLHLLSPAHRPLAVTQDLPSFWTNAYVEVRKDMRGRYPKHYWPEDPLQAEPTKRRKNRK